MTTTTITINGKTVTHGDRIMNFRGDVYTFDYAHDGKIYVAERTNGFNARVFVDKVGTAA